MLVNLQYSLDANVIPDAGIKNLELSPSNPLPGEKVNARFTVTSTNAPISSISYSIYIDGSIAGGGQVVSIEDGGNKLVTFTFPAERIGIEIIKYLKKNFDNNLVKLITKEFGSRFLFKHSKGLILFLAKYIQTQITSALQLQNEGFDKEFVLKYLKSSFYFLN